MKKAELTKEHKELVEAIMSKSERKITKAVSGLYVLKGYLSGRDYVDSINPNDEATFLEGMIDMILENMEDGSNIVYESASNGNYIVDYPRYDEAREKREQEAL